ncbi:MAG: hypothetical protein HFJ09_07215 [Lachnospiraceae bacterium]|nr:hypothetical protein [Lachnospiraceae bacterium]
MEKRKNIYATTNWEDATFSLRVKSLKTMLCSFHFIGPNLFLLLGYIFIIRREFVNFKNGVKLDNYNIEDKIFLGLFLVAFGICTFVLVLYIVRIFKLIFGETKFCNARITFVEKKREWRNSGYVDKYTITFQYGADGVSESKTIDEEEYSKNFHPKKYNGEYITVITPDMKYFILRKRYRVKKKREKNIGKRRHK